MPRSSWRYESIQVFFFLWLHCRKQRFYPSLLILWWCKVRELKVYNAWIVIYYSVFLWIGCVFLTNRFPWQFGIYLSIHFHLKPHKKRCDQLLCIQWQIPALITKHILTLAKKMMHLIAHGDWNPLHCKGYLCRLMHSSQKFLGLIARGWQKSKASLPDFEHSNLKHSLNPGFEPVLI